MSTNDTMLQYCCGRQIYRVSVVWICEEINSSDAGDGILWLWGPIPCLLMPWLLKSPEHQQAWYWLYRTDNMHFCSRLNFTYLGWAKSKIWFKMWLYLLQTLNQFSMVWLNSLRPSDAYMRQWHKPLLVQIMACRLSGAKPLSEPMLPYYQLDHKEHNSVKF